MGESKMLSRKMDRPNSRYRGTRETQIHIITIITTVKAIFMPRRPIIFFSVLRVFMDKLISQSPINTFQTIDFGVPLKFITLSWAFMREESLPYIFWRPNEFSKNF